MNAWNDPPDPHESQEIIAECGRLSAQIKRLERTIQREDDKIADKYPRKPGKRREELSTLYDELSELEASLEEALARQRYLFLWRDMYEVSKRKSAQL